MAAKAKKTASGRYVKAKSSFAVCIVQKEKPVIDIMDCYRSRELKHLKAGKGERIIRVRIEEC